ncbi:sulfatase-like hydrolase/transferase [Bradyrhizobium roseum]|uniref:sulfatase-like hydrolase/transferase n=1 Tax=Bradyrhizobium roseum TaxID=3056648 RepID=UPI002620AA2C|nr:sulfatase-like hydrolase/transferase [Bradyrhizobium roseus]WKA25728.1 sulfatase-like hydrolase/transferase [Bradyrhizobium roseus]
MVLTLILLAAIGVILLAERSVEHLAFAIATLFLSAAIISFFVGDFERAIGLAALLAAAITAASTIKHDYSALKLTVTDMPLLFAGTVPFFISQYPRAVLIVIAGAAAFITAVIATLIYGAGPPVTLGASVFLFAVTLICVVMAFRLSGGGIAFQRIKAQRRCFYSTFMASLIDPHAWRQAGGLTLSDIANDPLPLMPAVPARSTDTPDIIVIQHESIFDPRIFGLPVEPAVEAFLSPAHGLHGTLNVDIFGGGSWQSEFSLLTGLSSASFGSNAYTLFKQGAGRFHSSLPHALTALGYKTMLASSCRRSFLNYDEFYRSIGIAERIFSDDFPPPFDIRRFETTNSDAIFLEAAVAAFTKGIAGDPAPRFLYALTNFNHGPHDRSLAAPGQFETQRAFAASSLPDAQYAEYYARLAETASTWKRLRLALAENFPNRPVLIVHYGDHQPVLAKRIDRQLGLPDDARRAFRTFYAIEALNIGPDRLAAGRGADLDIAFLGTVALQQAGLPLDPIFATRASLLEQCRETYFASSSLRKRRFHRTLVDLGMIDIAPGVQRGRYLPTPTK